MLLKTVFIRFYKSFNFDYLRKFHIEASPQPWEYIDGMWYPYVRIPVDPKITTVVGANESGKSHLLTAIEKGISGEHIKREDFCRYSKFFTVEQGKMKWPEFGFEWSNLSDSEFNEIAKLCKIKDKSRFERFLFFRTNKDDITLYIPSENSFTDHKLSKEQAKRFPQLLPRVFRIDAEIALPDTVAIKELADKKSDRTIETIGRKGRFDLIERIYQSQSYFLNEESLKSSAAPLYALFKPIWNNRFDEEREQLKARHEAELELVRDLICKVAKVDPEALEELYTALRDGKEGHANGIIQEINKQLAASLNFPRWWAQDKKFQLVMSPREFDLVLTIRDRTDTDYSFNERSSGLKYFLSYYVQYRAHIPDLTRPEILLMDEPDTYLSSQGQQDLLKILEAFSDPLDKKEAIQVIYVTHSPFLINKNHAGRIRVLEKGISDEGTRVVKDAARNHYEPLRSAFGSFVGETTFIGNSNLMVEGPADQIFLAGIATYLRSRGTPELETLDLNKVTIVPAGSASSIPYLVYLAVGRDVEKPAVAVLLDSDEAGNQAKKDLKRGGPRNKQLLKEGLILQIGDLLEEIKSETSIDGLVEIEDMVPLAICALAAQRYVVEICGTNESQAHKINEEALEDARRTTKQTFAAVKKTLEDKVGEEYHIEKIGFARYVIQVVHELSAQSSDGSDLADFETRMKILFRRINEILRKAERELASTQLSGKLERLKKAFLQDHSVTAQREDAIILFEEIEATLDESLESDQIRLGIAKLKREFNINDAFAEPIERFSEFQEQLEGLKYAGRLATQNEI